jgi:predicted RNA-binding Zn-ribbon protein involved in translation (DUF1610 family)
MDLLERLQLDDLPEQQTRTMHLMIQMMMKTTSSSSGRSNNHNKILQEPEEEAPEPPTSLGFDNCAACGQELLSSSPSQQQQVSWTCPNCQRIRYCSESCRYADANVPLNDGATNNNRRTAAGGNHHEEEPQEPQQDDHGEDDGALGHTAIICSLLKLCNDDEMVEETIVAASGGLESTTSSSSSFTTNTTLAAARNRVRSEYESYPSTLANVLAEGPCYQSILRHRRAALTIHIIGASTDAELTRGPTEHRNGGHGDSDCHDDGDSQRQQQLVIQDYAEALSELVERNDLQQVNLLFIGPDCPADIPWNVTVPIPIMPNDDDDHHQTMTVGKKLLSVQTYRGLYHNVVRDGDMAVPAADIVVFFHPGFTHPDYDNWQETLTAIPSGTPFLLTSHTEMEAIADAQYLLEQDKIQSLPAGLADILQVDIDTADNADNDNNAGGGCFFAVNPFHGLRVRQNVTMANDLYVKNRWMLGGTIGPARTPTKPDYDTERHATKQRRIANAGLI